MLNHEWIRKTEEFLKDKFAHATEFEQPDIAYRIEHTYRVANIGREIAQKEGFDLVIADVPCSGLGVIRKKPEIRSKQPEEIKNLPQIQTDILENLSKNLKTNGVLLYSTCTILEEENEKVVEAFLDRHPDFVPEGFSIGGLRSESGMFTFWPNTTGTDGFFAAKLRRR